jgi:hypothetical protein
LPFPINDFILIKLTIPTLNYQMPQCTYPGPHLYPE